jgi:hypothetical protein
MTYEGMKVWDVKAELDGGEQEKIREALLDYCGQETLV